jgi:NADH-quinone oxidoreductase subunit E
MDASNDPSDAESEDDSVEDELEELLPVEELEDAAGEDELDENDLGEEASAGFDGERASYDDLKQIKGVGPAIEKTLNELGIRCYHQIAEMSEYDIDRVAHRLKGFRSRIYREDWIGQARELRDEKASGQQ